MGVTLANLVDDGHGDPNDSLNPVISRDVNKKKSILLLSQLYAPEFGAGAARAGDLAYEWTLAGHDVTILTGFPNYPTGKRFPGYDYGNRLFKREIINNIEIIRTYNWFFRPGSSVGRLLNAFSTFLSNAVWGLLTSRSFDLVIASSPQPFILLQALFISRYKKIPFIAEIRDPWPEVLEVMPGVNISSRPLSYRLLEKYIKKIYHACDVLVGVAENYRQLFEEKYGVPGSKITIIKNGCNSRLFKPGPKENNFREENNLCGKFVCSFVGNVGSYLRCETIVRAAHQLRNDPDIIFIFVGDGAGMDKVTEVKRQLGAENVLIFEPVPRDQVPLVYQASDVSIAHVMNHPYYQTCIGAKIWEIMGCGVPLLAGFKGETRQIVEEAQAGFAFEPENHEELAQYIKRIKADPILARKLGENGYKYVQSGYTRAQLAARYLSDIDRILGT